MRRVDNPPNDLFEDGDPTTGTLGTLLMAVLMNAWQEELATILENWNVTLDDNDDAQLATILQAKHREASLIGCGKFSWVDADQITIDPFAYHHDGTVEQVVYADSQLNYTFANLAVSDWSYLYLDDSAIVTADTNLIAVGQLTDSVTEPTWNAAKHGWYNGEDRCIFAVLTDGSSNILEFFHNGELVFFASKLTEIGETDYDTTWTDSPALRAPIFATRLNVIFQLNAATDANANEGWWRTNGAAGNGIEIGYCRTGYSEVQNVECNIITDSSHKIELKFTAAGLHKMKLMSNGWYFPSGM